MTLLSDFGVDDPFVGILHGVVLSRFPTARIVEENIRSLGVEDRSTLLVTSVFLWSKRDLGAATVASPPTSIPWLVFCSPPYALFHEKQDEMLDLIKRLKQNAAAGSIVVVEADEEFDFMPIESRMEDEDWDVRPYPPAVVGIWHN